MKHTKLIRIAVLLNFTSAFELLNFDTVKNKTDHVDYSDANDEFSDSTEDTDVE